MRIDNPSLVEGSDFTNLVIDSGTSFPVSGLDVGELFFRTDTGFLHVYNGSAWDNISTGVLPASPSFDDVTINDTLRLTSTADASLSSTLHALQIGLDSSVNVIIDNNEMMARNNGAVETFIINNEGGSVVLGTVGGTGNIFLRNSNTVIESSASSSLRVKNQNEVDNPGSPGNSFSVRIDLQTGTDTDLASFGFINGTSLDIVSYSRGAPIRLHGFDAAGVDNTIFFGDPDGASAMYYDGSPIIETTSTGADVTGILSVSGNLDAQQFQAGSGLNGGIVFEGGLHQITNNDGGGNFNIRVGNVFDEITEDGFAGHIVFSQANGEWTIRSTTASQTDGQTPVWAAGLDIQPNSLQFNNNEVLTDASGLNASNLTTGTIPDARVAQSTVTQHEGALGTESSTASTIVRRNGSGDINARLFRSEYDTTNASVNFIMTQIDTASNNYIRPSTPSQVAAAISPFLGGGGYEEQFFVKPVNTSRANTTTNTPDPHLAGAALEPSSNYIVACFLSLLGNGSTANDFKWIWDFNGEITSVDFIRGTHQAFLETFSTSTTITSGVAQFGNVNFTSPGGRYFVEMRFMVQTDSGYVNGTPMDLDWAQNSSNATATTVEAGSWMSVRKVG